MDEDGINRRDFLAAAKGLVAGAAAGGFAAKLVTNGDQYMRSPIEDKKPELTEAQKEAEHARWAASPVPDYEHRHSDAYEPPIAQPTEPPPSVFTEADATRDRTKLAQGATGGAVLGAMVGMVTRVGKGRDR